MPSFNDLINMCCAGSTNLAIVYLVILVVIFIWFLILTFITWRVYRFSQSLFGDTKKTDLKEILQEHIGRVGAVQIRVNDLEKILGELNHKSKRHISKVGIVRFNPFDDTGGDQSFTLALLDDADDGIVISSLHGRERTRIYAKPVRSGDPVEYEFSEEEKEAIRKARALGYK